MLKKIKKHGVLLLLAFSLMCVFISPLAGAKDDCEGDSILTSCAEYKGNNVYKDEKYKDIWDYIEVSDGINYAGRSIGWGLITFLANVMNGIENATSDVVGYMTKFLESDFVTEMTEKVDTIGIAILGVVLLFLAFYIMNGLTTDMKKTVLQFVVAILFIVGVSEIFTKGYELIPLAQDYFKSGEEYTLADEIILNAIVDVEYYRDEIDKGENPTKKNNLTKEELDYINITRHANSKEFDMKILGKKGEVLIVQDYDKKGFFGFGKEYIYLYKVDMVEVFIMLLGLFFMMLVLNFRMVIIFLDFGVMQIFSQLISIWSIKDPQALKKLAGLIGKSFITLFMLFFSLYYYMRFSSFIALEKTNILQKIILILANVIYAVSNNKVINTLFGVDTNMDSNWMQGYFAMRSIGRLGRGMRNMVSKPLSWAGNKFDKGILQPASRSLGNRFGKTIGEKRNAFLNDGSHYSDHKGSKDQKYLSPAYQWENKEFDNKSLLGKAGNKMFSKYLNEFNESGKQAYEKMFPTEKSNQRRAKENYAVQKQMNDITAQYPNKFGTPEYVRKFEADIAQGVSENNNINIPSMSFSNGSTTGGTVTESSNGLNTTVNPYSIINADSLTDDVTNNNIPQLQMNTDAVEQREAQARQQAEQQRQQELDRQARENIAQEQMRQQKQAEALEVQKRADEIKHQDKIKQEKFQEQQRQMEQIRQQQQQEQAKNERQNKQQQVVNVIDNIEQPSATSQLEREEKTDNTIPSIKFGKKGGI